MEDQLTTNCKLFDRSFALHNRKCGGWDGCVRLKPMPLLPLPLLWARIINEKYFMSRLLDCRSRGYKPPAQLLRYGRCVTRQKQLRWRL